MESRKAKVILCFVLVLLRLPNSLATRKRNIEYTYSTTESGTGNLPNVRKSFAVICSLCYHLVGGKNALAVNFQYKLNVTLFKCRFSLTRPIMMGVSPWKSMKKKKGIEYNMLKSVDPGQ